MNLTCEQIESWAWPLAFLVVALISGSIAYYWAKGRFTSKIVKYEYLNKWFIILLRLTIAITVVYIVILVILYFMHHSIPTLSNLGAIGDFVGGVLGTLVACMGAVYIIKSYKKQLEQIRLQTFEKTCSTMLDLHKQNVQEIELKISDTESYGGRNAFPQLVKELSEIYKQTEEAIKNVVASDPEKYAQWANFHQQQTLAHQLSYGYFFYDIEHYSTATNGVEAELCQAVSSRVEANLDDKYRCLQRHINLGHYYRHLYNMIKYIDEVELIKSKYKDNYIQIIRALLSDYEQILLYYNSMSKLGEPWNVSSKDKIEDVEDMCLMAKYRLLKNCPAFKKFCGISPTKKYAEEIKVYDQKKERFFDYLPIQ